MTEPMRPSTGNFEYQGPDYSSFSKPVAEPMDYESHLVEANETQAPSGNDDALQLLGSYFLQEGDFFVPLPNIANLLPQDELDRCGADAIEGFEADEDSMKEWREEVEEALKHTKFDKTIRDTPWQGAANFKSPLIM